MQRAQAVSQAAPRNAWNAGVESDSAILLREPGGYSSLPVTKCLDLSESDAESDAVRLRSR